MDPAQELYDSYAASAIPVLRVSAATGEGLPELRRAIKGKLNALTGNSGVGKSSILNAMEPVFGLPVGEVSKALGRGRHTTRHVEMFPLSGHIPRDKELRNGGYRYVIAGKYICMYRLIGEEVYVYHIAHGARNYPTLFKRLLKEDCLD